MLQPSRKQIGNIKQVQRRDAPLQTISTGYQASYDKGTTFVRDLVGSVGGILDTASGAINKYVKQDAVEQQDRALMGLDPTSGATTGGKRAHMLVKAQNAVMRSTKLLQQQSASFRGNEDEWQSIVNKSRQEVKSQILGEYPDLQGDPQTDQMFNTMFLEQSPKIASYRISDNISIDHQDRLTQLRDSIVEQANSATPDQMTKVANQVMVTAKALKLTPEEAEKVYVDVAAANATQGNYGLADASKVIKDRNGVSLYDRNGKMQKASVSGRRIWANNHQEAISEMTSDLLDEFNQGLSIDEFREKAGKQNDETGNAAWSANQINSAITKRAKTIAVTSHISDGIKDVNDGNLAGIKEYSKKDVDGIAKQYLKSVDDKVDSMVKQGIIDSDSEQAEKMRTQGKIKARIKLAAAGIQDKQYNQQIKNLMLITPDHFKDFTKEPEEFSAALDTWRSLPEETRVNLVPQKQAAFMDNYLEARALNMNPAQALDYAHKAGRNTYVDMRKTKKEADSLTSDVADGVWGNPFDNLPPYAKGNIQDEANKLLIDLQRNGYSLEKAKKKAKTYLETNYSMVGDTLVQGSTQNLAAEMNHINPADISLQLQGYLQYHKDKLLDNAGVGVDQDDLYFQIDTERGIARVRAGEGGVIASDAIPLSELGDVKYAQFLQDAKGEVQKDAARRILDKNRPNNFLYYGYTNRYANYANYANYAKFAKDDRPKVDTSVLKPSEELGTGAAKVELQDRIKASENGVRAGYSSFHRVWTPYDSDVGTSGKDTIAYGHKLTKEEKESGFIEIDGQAVRYKDGESELTDRKATKLMQQDMKAKGEALKHKVGGFSSLPHGVKNAFIDTAYNLGTNFMEKNPRAHKAFSYGDYATGFIYMLDAVNDGGKRTRGLLARRIAAYNGIKGTNKINKYKVNEDGSFLVHFDGTDELAKRVSSKVGDDGWYTVVKPKANSLREGTKTGTFDIK